MRACGIRAEHGRLRATSCYTGHEGAAARLRAGVDAQGFDQRRLLRDQRHMMWIGDGRASPIRPASRFARGIQTPSGSEVRGIARARWISQADRHPELGERGGTPDVPPFRPRQGRDHLGS